MKIIDELSRLKGEEINKPIRIAIYNVIMFPTDLPVKAGVLC